MKPSKTQNSKPKTQPLTIRTEPIDVKALANAALNSVVDPNSKRIIANIFRIAPNIGKKYIDTWLGARQAAIQVMFPNRTQLYDLYAFPLVMDLHIQFLMRKLYMFIKSSDFNIVDEDTEEIDEELTALFKKKWFSNYQKIWSENPFYGFSVMQLNDADPAAGTIDMELIPRKHIIPEKGAWIKYQSTNSYNYYRDTPLMDYLIEIGDRHDLGWLDKMAPLLIYKRNMMIYWNEFAENFGSPLIKAKTNSRDKNRVSEMEKFFKTIGNKKYVILDHADDAEILESKATDAYEVFAKGIETINTELSLMATLNVMSSEVGKNGSRAQAKVHQDEGDEAREATKDDFEGHINEDVMPFLAKHGFKTEGKKFQYVTTFDVSSDEFEQDTYWDENYEVDSKHWINKYGVPLGKRKSPQPVVVPGAYPGGKPDQDPDAGGKQPGDDAPTKKQVKQLLKRLSAFNMHKEIAEAYSGHTH